MTTQTHTVTIAQALASTASGLLVQDSAAAIAGALPNTGLVARVASFTVAAPAVLGGPQLLALAGLGAALHAPAGGLELNSALTVTASQLTALEAMGGFTMGASASLTLADTTAQVAGLLASHAAWFAQLSAVSVHLDGTAIGAYPATLLSNFAGHGKVLSLVAGAGQTALPVAAAAHDLGSNAASLDALATHVPLSFSLTNEGATVIAADAAGLATLHGFTPAAHTLYVADTAANIAAHAGLLFAQGFTQIQVASGTFAGTAAQLTDPTLRLSPGAHAQLAASASLGGAAAASMAGLPGFSLAQGVTLGVVDTAANLAATAASWLPYATAATLSASAIVPAVTAATLASVAAPLGAGFSLGGHSLIVADTMAALLALPAPAANLATGLVLDAPATASVAQLTAFAALPHAGLGGFAVSLVDSAANLLAVSGPALADAATATLGTAATLSAAQFSALRALPHFSTGGHALSVADTAAGLLSVAGGLAPATAALLSGNAQVSAAQLTALAALPGFSPAGHTLAVADTAANLLALPAATVALAAPVSLSADATLNAAQAALLTAEPGFSLAGHHLTIADTAANLAALAPAVAAEVSAEVMTASATVSAAAATALLAAPGFSLGAGAALTIADTLAALLNLPQQATALAGAVTLTAPATASAAQLAAFAALPHASTGGYPVGVVDSAANLLGLSPAALADTSVQTLAADSTVSAAQLAALASLPGFSAAGHAVNVVDTAASLLAVPAAALAQATSVTLSADATVSAAQAQALLTEPGFSPGAHHLTVADTAANLLALPPAAQLAATTLALAGDQTVSAATLTQLATLGIRFTEAGHALTCADTAADLATLTQAALALAAGEVLTAPATVSAAIAAALAALPRLAAAPGAVLTVQDSVANLLGLGAGTPAITGVVQLAPGSSVTLDAAQAHALAAIPHFAADSAAITVADSVADLAAPANAGWQAVAGSTRVTDTAANLAADAASPLVQSAAAVSLSGNAQVSAAAAAQIATIPRFSAGAAQLSVTDTAAAIAAHAGAVLAVAGQAVVTDSGPVSAAMADQLATVSAAGLLSFQGGDQLEVQDSFAALTDPANATGLALASRLGVADSAPNLVAAASHDWGALNPSYTLTQPGVVTAAQAETLAGLGSHFSAAGLGLSVADDAAGSVGAASALAALGIAAVVTDSAAHLGSQAQALAGMGAAIAAVHVTGSGSLSAAAAGALAPLAAKLAGPTLQVADTAAGVDSALSGLSTLGTHAAVSVTDTASDVAAAAPALASLAAPLTITLTDTAPVSAATAAGLSPVAAHLAAGTALAVTDTGAAIAAQAAGLAALGAGLGTLSLSDGTTQTAAAAAALAPLDGHLATGVMLTATGSAAAVAASQAGLTALAADHRLAAVLVANTSVADATAHAAVLAALPATVTISDSAADVDAGLASLGGLTGLASITLTDTGTPALSMSLATLAAAAPVLAKIATPFTITVNDTAAGIAADLAGPGSLVAAHLAQIGQVSASDGAAVTLTQAQLLTAGVDDGPGSALARFTGTLDVTGVDVAHLAQVASLAHAPAAIIVCDTGAAISADLASGSSALLAAGAAVTRIDVTDHAAVALTAAQALAVGVDDSAGSVLARLHGAGLSVSAASIAQLAPLAGLDVPAASIAVSDTAAAISADLASGTSALIASLPSIGSVAVSDGGTVSLTEPQVLAAQVDDGAGSVLSRMSGGSLAVTGVAAGDLAHILALGVAPSSIAITDSGAHLVSDLAGVVADLGVVSAITVTGAAPVLTANEALSAHVDDGAGSLIDKVSGHAFTVTGAAVAQVAPLLALAEAPGSITVSDSSADIAADLASGASSLAAGLAGIGSITVTHGTLTLTDAQADTILSTPALDAVMAKLAAGTVVTVTGVPVADLSAIAGSGWPHVTVAVADSAASVAADLASGSSQLAANSGVISSVTLDAGGTVDAATLTAMAALPHVSTGSAQLTVADGAAAIAGLGQAAISLADAVQVADSDANVAAQLDTLQAKFAGALSITLTNSAPAITVQAAQYAADTATIDAIANHDVVAVTGTAAALAPLAAQLGADAAVGSVAVTDSAADVIAGLATLQGAGAKLAVTLTDASLAANLVVPLLTIANLSPAGIPVVDTGAQIAAVAEAANPAATAYLNANGASLSADSTITATDAAALESLTDFGKAGHLLQVWDTAAHLTTASYQSALGNASIDSVHLRTMGGTATVTAATAAGLFTIPGFTTANPDGSANALNVADTAAHIEASLAALTTDRASIGAITVDAPATVSDQVLNDLQGLGAMAAPGAAISVRDTAAAIASNAAAQSGPQSILASAWALSGNGTVTEAQAAVLGGLAHFSTGGATITLSLGGNTTISVADANALGNIAPSLNLGGHELVVAGSVAQLAMLSPAALSLVTPALADSFADVAALPASSPLLAGTVEVTGADPLTAASVAAFLALVHTGPGPGIAAGSLTFDQPHAVDDTVADLRALTSGAGWTGATAVHADFILVARDTAANLANLANTGFLSGLSATGLAGNATINAALATSLANAASAIHFVHDRTITVQDTPANLLNPANAAGLGEADALQLSGPATVDAADAESLLGLSHFTLSTPLVVSDSSANLLDGALGGAITGSGFGAEITVQLAGPETLDADTAETLVSLPGFADTTNLTIADSSSYLLNGANLSAEQMAASVTLAGDETVSANTVLRLSEVPHFTPGSSHLVLAGNDFANAATLHAIAGDGAAFQANGHTVTLTQDVLDLSPAEYAAQRTDNVVANGHAIGITPSAVSVTDTGNMLSVSATGVAGGTLHVYGADGTLLSSATEAAAGFTVSAADAAPGHSFTVSDIVGGVEGAPVIVLDAAALESAANAAGISFSAAGAIQVDPGKALNLYQAGAVPMLSHAALVYDPVAHTISLEGPSGAPVTLVTLGGTTHPGSLDLSEITIKHHG